MLGKKPIVDHKLTKEPLRPKLRTFYASSTCLVDLISSRGRVEYSTHDAKHGKRLIFQAFSYLSGWSPSCIAKNVNCSERSISPVSCSDMLCHSVWTFVVILEESYDQDRDCRKSGPTIHSPIYTRHMNEDNCIAVESRSEPNATAACRPLRLREGG